MNLSYELFSACTSIILEDPTDKTPMHFRTMDWDLDLLRQLTIEVAGLLDSLKRIG